MNLTLPQLITHLVTEKSFYAMVLNQLKRVIVPGLGTMGVAIRDGRYVLLVDPEFVNGVSMGFGVYVVEHEMVHIIMDHLPRFFELLTRLPEDGEAKKRSMALYQIAMDCADNTLLRNNKYFASAQKGMRAKIQAELDRRIATGLCPPDKQLSPTDGLILPEIYGLPEEGSFEFYMHELLKMKKDFSNDNNIVLYIDLNDLLSGDAPQGESGDGKSQKVYLTPDELQGIAQQLRAQARQILKNAVNECNRARGTIPSECREFLDHFLAAPITPWWEIMASRIISTKRTRYDRGISRPNRTLMAMAEEDASIIPAIGVERDPRYRVFFFRDTSGSMYVESLRIAASEMTHLLHSDDDMEVRVMDGDSEVHRDLLLHSGDTVPCDAIGRGGTDFDAYFTYMQKYCRDDSTCPDLVVVYTDGYAPDVSPSCRLPAEIPVIWLLTPHGRRPEGYGEVIVCDPSQNENYKESD